MFTVRDRADLKIICLLWLVSPSISVLTLLMADDISSQDS